MKNIFYKLVVSLSLIRIPAVLAQSENNTVNTVNPANPLDKLQTIGKGAGYGDASSTTLMDIVGTTINILLGTLGIIFVILIIVAGFNWMTAGGDKEKIEKAGDTIREAIIGLIIIVGAFAIWTFIDRVLISGGSSSNNGSNL